MALLDIQVGVPGYRAQTAPFLAAVIHPESGLPLLVVVGDHERHIPVVVAQPDLVVPQQRKELLVRQSILVPDDEELLFVLHQRGHVFPEQGERRVRDHYVGLLERLDALVGSEIPMAFQDGRGVGVVLEEIFDVGQVNGPVAVVVLHLGYLDLVGDLLASGLLLDLVLRRIRFGLPVQPVLHTDDGVRYRRSDVACGYQLLQSQTVEVHGEILEEIGFVGIVAIAEDHLVPEMLAVMGQFRFDILDAGVELVLLGLVSRVQCLVASHRNQSVKQSDGFNDWPGCFTLC